MNVVQFLKISLISSIFRRSYHVVFNICVRINNQYLKYRSASECYKKPLALNLYFKIIKLAYIW